MADPSSIYGHSSTLHGPGSFSDATQLEGQTSVEHSSSKSQNVRNRTGCLTCKRRKKKCDETKPVCKNCLRTSYVCEGYPPVRYFRNDESSIEQDQADSGHAPKSGGTPQSEQDTLAALHAANEQIRILTQRVHQLEQELSNEQRDRAKAAPRLPSLRSMMQPEVMERYGQLCPICGQDERLSSAENDSVRPLGAQYQAPTVQSLIPPAQKPTHGRLP